jgi:hypothetical protein
MNARQLKPKSYTFKVVTPTSTNVQLFPDVYSFATTVVIQADSGNDESVCIGDSTMGAYDGIELAPGASLTLAVDPTGQFEKLKLSDLYVRTDSVMPPTVRLFALITD